MSRVIRIVLATVLVPTLLQWSAWPATAGHKVDLIGPPGSGAFGSSVTVLPNGNIVITDPYYSTGGIFAVGAVYLYNGATGMQISKLVGSQQDDRVGSGGVIILSNGNYVIQTPFWQNGPIYGAGAVTWGDKTVGVNGIVSADNSLVGSTINDHIGGGINWGEYGSVVLLSNGNYLVRSPNWDNGTAQEAGAVTWGNGTNGVKGPISAENSLVGHSPGDLVGAVYEGGSGFRNGVAELSNGNFVVRSPYFDSGTIIMAGAVTWGNGTSGTTGVISSTNSLVGSANYDQVGAYPVKALSNGNYVVSCPNCDIGSIVDAGAATWGDGTAGTSGQISSANSLVGSKLEDKVSGRDSYGALVTALSNGNYVVRSPQWNKGSILDVGAVTWGDGTIGISGPISSTNSLIGVGAGEVVALSNGNYAVSNPGWRGVGAVTWGDGMTGVMGVISSTNSLVGSPPGGSFGGGCDDGMFERDCLVPLNNGNFVVASPHWHGVGAVTWVNGSTGATGIVSVTNSLVGSRIYDNVGHGEVVALSNGNYAVNSPDWSNGPIENAGAVTLGNGTTGITGVVSSTNSLVGGSVGDHVGSDGVMALSNGSYLVRSRGWHNGSALGVGAVTWGNGMTGVTGIVSSTNSLVGSHEYDFYWTSVSELNNGNYLVVSKSWDNGTITDAGAVTWGNGTTGTSGVISSTNSLIGSSNGDGIGSASVIALSNGNYVVLSPGWDDDANEDAGAATWGDGTTGISGPVSLGNSLVGSSYHAQLGDQGGKAYSDGSYIVSSTYLVTLGDGSNGSAGYTNGENSVSGYYYSLSTAYDVVNHQLVVGRPGDNIVTILRLINEIYSLTLLTVGNGSVTASPNQAIYLNGNEVQLTASADPDWIFSGWSGDLTGSANPAILTIDGNKTITATFTRGDLFLPLISR